MDTSKEYVEMCRKAVEIQELWKPEAGDWTLSHRDGVKPLDSITISLAGLTPFGANGARIRSDMIWLPRQDQLQEMVCSDIRILIDSFVDCFNGIACIKLSSGMKNSGLHIIDFDSMEQLWFAFVMHEKHGKKWDGEEWG